MGKEVAPLPGGPVPTRELPHFEEAAVENEPALVVLVLRQVEKHAEKNMPAPYGNVPAGNCLISSERSSTKSPKLWRKFSSDPLKKEITRC
jgi:hypothetical protein